MRVDDLEIEGTIHLTPFESSDCLTGELTKEYRDNAGKIKFAVLISVKQNQLVEGVAIGIKFTHILLKTTGKETLKKYYRSIHMESISLNNTSDMHPHGETFERTRYGSDVWVAKKLMIHRFLNVPTDGAGCYAVVLTAERNGTTQFLDCAYLDIV